MFIWFKIMMVIDKCNWSCIWNCYNCYVRYWVRIVNCYFVGSMNIEIIGIVFIFSLSYFKIVDNGIY